MDADFFEPPAPPPEPERWEPPQWFQPPVDELAALVPDRRLLARSDRGVVILLSHIDVFRTGCMLRIRVSVHNRDDTRREDWFDMHDVVMGGRRHPRGHSGGGELPDELLRFGVRFDDGSKATTTAAPLPHDRDSTPHGPVLMQHGGGGGGSDQLITSTWSLWLWPLPPPEPFDLVFEWPAFGVAMERVEIDGGQITRAADSVRSFWDEDENRARTRGALRSSAKPPPDEP